MNTGKSIYLAAYGIGHTAISVMVISCLLFAGSCDTPGVVDPVFDDYYIKYYGSEGEQYGVDLVVNTDGTMILLGNSVSTIGRRTAFMVKVDAKGNIIWQRQCGGDNESAVDFELIKKGPYEGSLVVVTNIGPEASSRIRLIRIDQHGVGVDSLILPLHSNGIKQVAKSITALEIGSGYVITGYADGALIFDSDPIIAADVDQADLFALKIDESFQQMESILLQGGERVGSAVKAYESSINNQLTYYIFGQSDRFATKPRELSIEIILTRSGIQVDGSYQLRNEDQEVAAVLQTPTWLGEGYLIAGTSKNANSTVSDLYLVKVDNALNVSASLNGKIELNGGPKKVECVAAAIAGPEGYFILANEIIESSNTIIRDIILAKITYEGAVDWQRKFGTGSADDSGGAVVSLPDGRIAVVGTMELKTKKKMALIVVNRHGHFSN